MAMGKNLSKIVKEASEGASKTVKREVAEAVSRAPKIKRDLDFNIGQILRPGDRFTGPAPRTTTKVIDTATKNAKQIPIEKTIGSKRMRFKQTYEDLMRGQQEMPSRMKSFNEPNPISKKKKNIVFDDPNIGMRGSSSMPDRMTAYTEPKKKPSNSTKRNIKMDRSAEDVMQGKQIMPSKMNAHKKTRNPKVDNMVFKGAALGVGGYMVLNMFDTKGEQANGQLYGQY